ncbi:MAG TPA: PrpF family protein, partial [Citreicella sp.]|nr:PrpF family protein [Citreicella sp.]
LALRIGTPSGIVGTGALRDPASGTITAARILRTQRRLMEGRVLVPAPATLSPTETA